ncbi:TetR/AcrR family transcriptional regulator [Gordonia rhizosphera]|uniref:TetR/AcrR family transcriptional regulator n=1 Tax=Gordonia rhizosphera TaxID=83341 RepID=UPI0002DFD7B3|nr:TetR family transcriptional regulator [Gordonia rhizosphera]
MTARDQREVAEHPSPPRRTKGRPPTLSEDQIVDAALAVIRSEGLDALSMRRLSRELGRSQMAVYSYVADKQALLDLVARRTLAGVEVPEEGAWDVRLRGLIDNIDRRLRQQPGIAGLLLQRMLHSDQHIMDAMMEIMHSAGLPERQVVLAYAMIHTYLFGRYQVTLAPVENSDNQLPPTLAKVTTHLDELHGADYYNFGIDTLIDGLRARIEAARTDPGPQ